MMILLFFLQLYGNSHIHDTYVRLFKQLMYRFSIRYNTFLLDDESERLYVN